MNKKYIQQILIDNDQKSGDLDCELYSTLLSTAKELLVSVESMFDNLQAANLNNSYCIRLTVMSQKL